MDLFKWLLVKSIGSLTGNRKMNKGNSLLLVNKNIKIVGLYPIRKKKVERQLPNIEWYRIYARFLETDDECFNYFPVFPPKQGRWFIYGIYLPDDILKKIYFENIHNILNIR